MSNLAMLGEAPSTSKIKQRSVDLILWIALHRREMLPILRSTVCNVGNGNVVQPKSLHLAGIRDPSPSPLLRCCGGNKPLAIKSLPAWGLYDGPVEISRVAVLCRDGMCPAFSSSHANGPRGYGPTRCSKSNMSSHTIIVVLPSFRAQDKTTS